MKDYWRDKIRESILEEYPNIPQEKLNAIMYEVEFVLMPKHRKILGIED